MTRPWSVDPVEVRAAVYALYDRGETDDWEGGVHPSTVADHLGISPSTAEKRCRELAADGLLDRVQGIHPNQISPRTSYAPPEPTDETGYGGRI